MEPGRLGGPDCRLPLVQDLAQILYGGRNPGSFYCIACESCRHGLRIEKGYENTAVDVAALNNAAPPRSRRRDGRAGDRDAAARAIPRRRAGGRRRPLSR